MPVRSVDTKIPKTTSRRTSSASKPATSAKKTARTVSAPKDGFSTTAAKSTAAASTLAPTPVVLSGTSTPQRTIGDKSTVTSTLALSADVNVSALSLKLDISHSWKGDLKVTLKSPSGKSVVVHDRTGGSADDLKGSFDLFAFKGESAKGTWTLTVEDVATGDTGTLNSWSLEGTGVKGAPPKPTSNDFRTVISGRYPPVSAGSFLEQLKQASNTARLAVDAARGLSDLSVASKLRSLSPMPVTSDRSSQTDSNYFSRLQGISPDDAYAHMVNNPTALFTAAGMKFQPATSKLTDGARLMLEDKGPPKVWFPIEVRLDPIGRQVKITTLDGHPLRGTNNFRFQSDGQGGTNLQQFSNFQLSSKAVQVGMGESQLAKQHATWENFHAAMFDALIRNA